MRVANYQNMSQLPHAVVSAIKIRNTHAHLRHVPCQCADYACARASYAGVVSRGQTLFRNS